MTSEESILLRILAGYRNRLVHFYHEVSAEELFDVCKRHLGNVDRIVSTYRQWLRANPEKIDTSL